MIRLPLILACCALTIGLFASLHIKAQEVEPGVGIWGVLETGRSYSKQVSNFEQRNSSHSPDEFGVDVEGQEKGIVTRLKFRAPGFYVFIRGVLVKNGEELSESNIEKLGTVAKMERHDNSFDFPMLGVKVTVAEIKIVDSIRNKVSSIEVYRPRPES